MAVWLYERCAPTFPEYQLTGAGAQTGPVSGAAGQGWTLSGGAGNGGIQRYLEFVERTGSCIYDLDISFMIDIMLG